MNFLDSQLQSAADADDRDAFPSAPGDLRALPTGLPKSAGSHRPLSRRPFVRHIRVADPDDLSPVLRISKFRPFDINAQGLPDKPVQRLALPLWLK